MHKPAVGTRVRIHPSHWPEGQTCVCEVVAVDDKYVDVRDVARPTITFPIPLKDFDKLERA